LKKFYAPKVTATDSTAFWALGNDVNDIPTQIIGTTNHHHARLDTMAWLNVGVQKTNTVSTTAVTVSVSTMFTKNNTMIYLSVNGELTVGALFEISPGIFRISNVPIGTAANLVGVAAVNGQYYAAVMPVTVTNSAPINLNMTSMSQASMQSLINAVP